VPPIRALLNNPAQVPQQALGALSFVAEVLNKVLVHLEDPDNFVKFRRLKRAALRKKLAKAPELAEGVLVAAGFHVDAPDAEHIEWGPADEVLPQALAVLALITRVQERVQASGLKAISETLDANIGPAEVLGLTYGNAQLLEPREGAVGGMGNTTQTASSVSGTLISRTCLRARLPNFAAAMEEFRNLFEPGAREKALSKAVARSVLEVRAAQCPQDSTKLSVSSVLYEVAQLAASGALVNLRRPGTVFAEGSTPTELAPIAPASVEAEPDGEPGVMELSVHSELPNLREFIGDETCEAALTEQPQAPLSVGSRVQVLADAAECERLTTLKPGWTWLPQEAVHCGQTGTVTKLRRDMQGVEVEFEDGKKQEYIVAVLKQAMQELVAVQREIALTERRIEALVGVPANRSPYLAPPPTGVGAPGQVVPVLLDCVPCFRLGLPHATLMEIIGIREFPSFFTLGLREKPFEVSLKALSEHIVAEWWPRIH
jgi:hypothetical protein